MRMKMVFSASQISQISYYYEEIRWNDLKSHISNFPIRLALSD